MDDLVEGNTEPFPEIPPGRTDFRISFLCLKESHRSVIFNQDEVNLALFFVPNIHDFKNSKTHFGETDFFSVI
jgi:hypothetical protein